MPRVRAERGVIMEEVAPCTTSLPMGYRMRRPHVDHKAQVAITSRHAMRAHAPMHVRVAVDTLIPSASMHAGEIVQRT
ncbi:hypothetical protein DVT68_09875 [Dyella solisilvae]|uniref:Uncharacterized protein n=1 Tax=Dyella solisilvae TaxID=1920168 RepID=A0A370K833_9GAMM|nr:hypothetical protein DVT68_09875 [Dyella solisilvae]